MVFIIICLSSSSKYVASCLLTCKACIQMWSCRKVIHTVDPKYAVKYHTAAENALSHCYRSCLEILIENGLQRLFLKILLVFLLICYWHLQHLFTSFKMPNWLFSDIIIQYCNWMYLYWGQKLSSWASCTCCHKCVMMSYPAYQLLSICYTDGIRWWHEHSSILLFSDILMHQETDMD